MTTSSDFTVQPVQFSDCSVGHNVVGAVDQGAAGKITITIGCEDRKAALALADALNSAAWIELEPEEDPR